MGCFVSESHFRNPTPPRKENCEHHPCGYDKVVYCHAHRTEASHRCCVTQQAPCNKTLQCCSESGANRNSVLSSTHTCVNCTSCCNVRHLSCRRLNTNDSCDFEMNLLLKRLLASTASILSANCSSHETLKDLNENCERDKCSSYCSSLSGSIAESSISQNSLNSVTKGHEATAKPCSNKNDEAKQSSFPLNKKDQRNNRRTGKICRKGTPYPHPPEMTVEECAAILTCNANQFNDKQRSADDLDLDSASVVSCKKNLLTNVLSDVNPLFRTSRSFENLSSAEGSASIFQNKEWPHKYNVNIEHLYHYHLYESILYGNGKATPQNIPQMASPPPLPQRPPNLLRPFISSKSFYNTDMMGKNNLNSEELLRIKIADKLKKTSKVNDRHTLLLKEFDAKSICDESCERIFACTDPNCPDQFGFDVSKYPLPINKDNDTLVVEKAILKNTQIPRNNPTPHNSSLFAMQKIGAVLKKNLKSNSDIIQEEGQEGIPFVPDCPDCVRQTLLAEESVLLPGKEKTCQETVASPIRPAADICLSSNSSEVTERLPSSSTKRCNEERDDIEMLKNIPPKAKMTLGIGEYNSAPAKGNKLASSFIKRAKTSNLLPSGPKTSILDKFSRDKKSSKIDPNLTTKTQEKANLSDSSTVDFIHSNLNQTQELLTGKESVSVTGCAYSPPPTPPPHAAVFCYDVQSCDETDDETEDYAENIPVPPPRTTSTILFQRLANREPSKCKSNTKSPKGSIVRPLPPLPSRTFLTAAEIKSTDDKYSSAFPGPEKQVGEMPENIPPKIMPKATITEIRQSIQDSKPETRPTNPFTPPNVHSTKQKSSPFKSEGLEESFASSPFPLPSNRPFNIVPRGPEDQDNEDRTKGPPPPPKPSLKSTIPVVKSGSYIQPVDDEYGFNVASYLI